MKKEDYPKLAQEDGTYFLWDVLIKKGDYYFNCPVFRRKEEHNHGKWNNCSPDYWLLDDKQNLMRALNQIDPENKNKRYRETNEEMDIEEEKGNRYRWIPYGDKYTQPVNTWSYEFEAYNVIDHYGKYGSDEYSVKAKTSCKMFCNGRNLWNFTWSGKDIDGMMHKARVLSDELTSHYGLNVNNPDSIIGKKVWYYDQEGVIVDHYLPEDRLVIRSEKPDGTGFDLKTRSKNKDNAKNDDWPDSDWHNSKEVHTGFFDHNIDWFRD